MEKCTISRNSSINSQISGFTIPKHRVNGKLSFSMILHRLVSLEEGMCVWFQLNPTESQK